MKEEAQTLHIQLFFPAQPFDFHLLPSPPFYHFPFKPTEAMLPINIHENNDLTRMPPLFHVKQKTQRKIDILESIVQNENNDKKGSDHDGNRKGSTN